MIQENIEHVNVYGVLHSPWVQAVLLGLHEKKHLALDSAHPFTIVISKLGLDDASC